MDEEDDDINLSDAFKLFDLNNDHRISVDELECLLKTLGYSKSSSRDEL